LEGTKAGQQTFQACWFERKRREGSLGKMPRRFAERQLRKEERRGEGTGYVWKMQGVPVEEEVEATCVWCCGAVLHGCCAPPLCTAASVFAVERSGYMKPPRLNWGNRADSLCGTQPSQLREADRSNTAKDGSTSSAIPNLASDGGTLWPVL